MSEMSKKFVALDDPSRHRPLCLDVEHELPLVLVLSCYSLPTHLCYGSLEGCEVDGYVQEQMTAILAVHLLFVLNVPIQT
jgi:hypothetical protein